MLTRQNFRLISRTHSARNSVAFRWKRITVPPGADIRFGRNVSVRSNRNSAISSFFFFQHELFSPIVFRRFSRLTTKPHRVAVFSGFSPEGVSKPAHPLFLCQIGHQKKDVQLSDGRFGVKAIVSLRLLYSDFFGIRVPLPGCGVEHYNFGRGSHHLYLRLVGDPYGLAAQVSGCQTLNLRIAQ